MVSDNYREEITKSFAGVDGEQSIPIAWDKDLFEFSAKWFRDRNQVTFSTFLSPKFDSTKPVNLIQIGVFEGMDLVWQLQNTLKHPESRAVGIDPWRDPSGKRSDAVMDEIEDRAVRNVARFGGKVTLIRGYSQEVLRGHLQSEFSSRVGHFDIIVIDGDHEEEAALEDAELSFRMVKKGGWLLFDDVYNKRFNRHHVFQATRRFAKRHEGQVKRVWQHRHCECYEKLV